VGVPVVDDVEVEVLAVVVVEALAVDATDDDVLVLPVVAVVADTTTQTLLQRRGAVGSSPSLNSASTPDHVTISLKSCGGAHQRFFEHGWLLRQKFPTNASIDESERLMF